MEAQRLHLLDWTDRINKTPFSPIPQYLLDARAVTPKVGGSQFKRTAKLTADQVRAIKAALAAGETLPVISVRHGITTSTVIKIRDGQSWKDIE